MSALARYCLVIWVVGALAAGPFGPGSSEGWGSWDGGDGKSYGGGGYGGGGGDGEDGGGGGFGNFGGSSSAAAGGGLDLGNGLTVDRATYYRSVHGILAAVAFVGVFPLGSILLRLTPGRPAWIVHAIAQIAGWVLYVAAAALGIFLVRSVRLPPDGSSLMESARTNAHPIIGLVVLALLVAQPVLGALHHSRFKRLGRRTWPSHAHLLLGRAAVTLGIVNGGLGLALSGSPRRAVVAYAAAAAVMWFLWLLAACLGEWRYRRRQAAAAKEAREAEKGGEAAAAAAAGHHHHHPAAAAAAAIPSRGSSSRRHNHTPSPPYTPGPLYGGPGLNNTPRGAEGSAPAPAAAHAGHYAKGASPPRSVSSASSSSRDRRR